MDPATRDTREATLAEQDPAAQGAPSPGLLLVFSDRQPRLSAIPLEGGEAVLGRGDVGRVHIPDGCMSRQHARVRYDGGTFTVEDLASRNGTAVDGEALPPHVPRQAARIVRMGDSLFLLSPDVRPWLGAEVVKTQDGRVLGPEMQRLFDSIGRTAGFGGILHLKGESGVGKESAARAFHDFGPSPGGPFVALNCAAIPDGIAERILFGARKGAYSGAAADADGVIQAAHGGTLFLDEVAELDPAVQAKLLRVIESREVLPLGATRPVPVNVRICSATHKDLRAEVSAGRMRQDLYYRIGRPEVVIAPLRERLEEIPWLITTALERVGAAQWPHSSLVEACLLRPWPGNIRELLTEIQYAAQDALARDSQKVQAIHLSASAGTAFTPAPELVPGPSGPSTPSPSSSTPASQPPSDARSAPQPERATATPASSISPDPSGSMRAPSARAQLESVLRRTGGNVSEAARLLGLHRTQLRRLLAHHQIDARRFPRLPEVPPEEEEAWPPSEA